MTTQVLNVPIETVEADVLIAGAPDKDAPRGAVLARLNELTGGIVEELYRNGDLSGKALEVTVVHRPAGLKAKRLALVGLGKPPFDLRRAIGAAIRQVKGKGAVSAALAVEGTADEAAAMAQGAILGNYEPDRYRTDKDGSRPIDSVQVVTGAAGAEEAVRRAAIIADAQNFARDLANEPANRMTPSVLADRAREVAAEGGLDVEVMDRDRMKQLGMGALLGVAQGSAEPPALIILRYRPEQAGADHLGLVGKAVTFDTGGISIKPSEGMEKMKYDMSGGAAVIAAMRAIAQLKPALQITALVPAVENMPGGRAQRPGDIVTTLAGKTVEVLNTDAEGRLILADAVTYAKGLGCTHLVDAATLTGAIVIALGHVNAGLFATDDALAQRVLAASQAAGEKMWRMPLDDDYKEQLKTPFADIPNIGSRWGGAITGALFIREFAGDTPWVHLDIAGTAWLDDAKPWLAKGPTGIGVRTFVELASRWRA